MQWLASYIEWILHAMACGSDWILYVVAYELLRIHSLRSGVRGIWNETAEADELCEISTVCSGV
jgi:hypothetical protein